jgi:hypothetical protein
MTTTHKKHEDSDVTVEAGFSGEHFKGDARDKQWDKNSSALADAVGKVIQDHAGDIVKQLRTTIPDIKESDLKLVKRDKKSKPGG